MATDSDPIVNSWYKHLDKGQPFQVVAVDENGFQIEIQYIDGDVEEIDIDDWYFMDLEQIVSPEDIAGALDVSEPDDMMSVVAGAGYADWDSEQGLNGFDDQDFSEGMTEFSLEDEASYEETWDEM